MRKEMYIFRALEGESYSGFGQRMFSLCEKLSEGSPASEVKMTITLERPPRLSVIPFRKDKVAVISLGNIPEGNCDGVLNEDKFTGRYLVEEAVPVEYEKTWKDGDPTPGVCLLTLFHRKPSIDPGTFLDRWHNGHTPLSLRLHPLWNYNRNVVTAALDENSPDYDGIVEEHFRTRKELLNPFIFFGPPIKTPYHMLLVLKDSRSFIDMKRIETYLAAEYHFRSAN